MKPDPRSFRARTGRRATLGGAAWLAALWLTATPGPAMAADEPVYLGRPLAEVLRQFQDRGLELIFSSAVVGQDLRVTVEPVASTPRAVLAEILPPLGLRPANGPGGAILVLPAVRVEADPGETPRIAPTFITEVVVTPGQYSLVREEQSSTHSVTGDTAVLSPTIGGDLTRLVELLPGVAAADNTAAFNVRGSVARDVSLILDGLELYDPFHLQTFHSPYSLIDTHVVDRIDFFGGGFTADLGDRHGGFVEIATVVPETSGRGELELGTLNSRFSYRAPGGGGGPSWLVSGRGWYPESVLNTTELGEGEKLNPRFGDLYAKTAWNLGSRHLISAHAMLAYDRLKFNERGEKINESVDAVTRNGYVWLRALDAWSTRFTSETILSGGRIERTRNGVSSEGGAPLNVGDERTVDFFGLKHDSIWFLSDAHAVKLGADLRRLQARYRYFNELDETSPEPIALDPDGTSMGLYLAYRVRLAQTLAIEFGGRWDRQDYTSDNQLSPRFNTVWQPRERSEIRLAVGRFHQSQRIHELSIEDGETAFARAEVAEQIDLSFQQASRGGTHFRLDAYYRKLSDLRQRFENLFEPIELFPETVADREPITPDGARLRGVELLVRGSLEQPFFWWASYTLSAADDRILGLYVPRSWDQRHAAKFLIGFRRAERWSLSLSGSAHTGWPTTPVTGEITSDGEELLIPGTRNSIRYPDYLRFDFKARRAVELRQGKLWLTLELANLTDRDNACCIDTFVFDGPGPGPVDVSRRLDYWLGVTPSFNVLWEF